MKNKFIGCLFGVAIGDSLGAFIEGLNKVNYEEWIKKVENAKTLIYTDDTHMTIGVAESLIRNKGFNGEDIAKTLIKNYEDEPYRGYGPGPPKVFKLIKSGKTWIEASKEVYPDGSFGNGAAMRVAPIALLYCNDLNKLREAVYWSSHITHAHNLGKEGAALQAYAITLSFKSNPKNGFNEEDFVDELTNFVESEIYKRKLHKLKNLLYKPFDKKMIIKQLGVGIEAFNSVPTAIYAFLVNKESFKKSVIYAASLGGDADTIASMTGAIAGAYHGEEAIPKDWINKLENQNYIRELAEKLYLTFKLFSFKIKHA
jgi:poly(ADP-ribose) glycohydrolase ARH3